VSEGIIKSKDMMPRGDLPSNGNVWQTTEPVKLENKGTSIIGSLLSDLAVQPKSKGPTSLMYNFTHYPCVTKACATIHAHVHTLTQ